jgi:hypothetical protein
MMHRRVPTSARMRVISKDNGVGFPEFFPTQRYAGRVYRGAWRGEEISTTSLEMLIADPHSLFADKDIAAFALASYFGWWGWRP